MFLFLLSLNVRSNTSAIRLSPIRSHIKYGYKVYNLEVAVMMETMEGIMQAMLVTMMFQVLPLRVL